MSGNEHNVHKICQDVCRLIEYCCTVENAANEAVRNASKKRTQLEELMTIIQQRYRGLVREVNGREGGAVETMKLRNATADRVNELDNAERAGDVGEGEIVGECSDGTCGRVLPDGQTEIEETTTEDDVDVRDVCNSVRHVPFARCLKNGKKCAMEVRQGEDEEEGEDNKLLSSPSSPSSPCLILH